MKRKELLWILILCLHLLGVGWYFSRQSALSRVVPFSFIIKDLQVVPVTPREASKGFDTKVIFKTRLVGIPPGEGEPDFYYVQRINLKLTYQKGDVILAVPVFHKDKEPYISREELGKEEQYEKEQTCLLRLSKVPLQYGQLNLDVSAFGEQFSMAERNWKRRTPKTRLSFPLRHARQRISPPRQNHARLFTVQKITYQWFQSTGPRERITIRLYFQSHNKAIALDPQSIKIENHFLITEKGRFPGTYGQWSNGHGPDGKLEYINIDERGESFPSKAKNITLKLDLSINNCWPLPISVVLRKNGINMSHLIPNSSGGSNL